ncbi:hypothetical protein D8B26_000417 [Coccidioides posadasii str. Silveira]|uniref:uncharacterized protein n=1 Tax=Coccidioides posadasii (strain RMSCC 757 / Silveira) TaxID=443226 RepID=UPI001BEF1ACA|nr:hypothetical protein D8B26_000417 [Coccidioides posadasii str. Silveira]
MRLSFPATKNRIPFVRRRPIWFASREFSSVCVSAQNSCVLFNRGLSELSPLPLPPKRKEKKKGNTRVHFYPKASELDSQLVAPFLRGYIIFVLTEKDDHGNQLKVVGF